jgi:hypothetical protein
VPGTPVDSPTSVVGGFSGPDLVSAREALPNGYTRWVLTRQLVAGRTGSGDTAAWPPGHAQTLRSYTIGQRDAPADLYADAATLAGWQCLDLGHLSVAWDYCESTFATVRHRTKVTKGPGSKAAGLAMAFKLIEAGQGRWRAVNAPHLVALVRNGAVFKKGKLVVRSTARGLTETAA